jgi:hypothetical protein
MLRVAMCKTAIFPTSPARIPPPRNQTSKMEKTTVDAKIIGFGVSRGTISGNHVVLSLMRPQGSAGHLSFGALIG